MARHSIITYFNCSPFVRPSFCPFVCLEFFCRAARRNFLIFCTKLERHLTKYVLSPILRKNIALGFSERSSKRSKVQFFKFYGKSVCRSFLIFAWSYCKINFWRWSKWVIFGQNLVLMFPCKRESEMDPKWGFLYYQNTEDIAA